MEWRSSVITDASEDSLDLELPAHSTGRGRANGKLPLATRINSTVSVRLVAAGPNRSSQVLHTISVGGPKATSKVDRFRHLSVVGGDDEEGEEKHEKGSATMPLLLSFFVCFLAIIAGFLVVGVNKLIRYTGCPMGINGCNEDRKNDPEVPIFLIGALQTALHEQLPEDVIFLVMGAVGAVICAQLMIWLPPYMAFQIRGGGTVQSLLAVAAGERILIRAALARCLATTIYLGTGGTLGVEGMSIQLCTSIATLIGWQCGIRSAPTQSLLASLGFSCGFAASFNSPLAGILFAMEELQHVSPRLSKAIICIILVVSSVATAVVRMSNGNYSMIETKLTESLLSGVQGGSLDSVFGEKLWMLIAVPIGVLCSFVGLLIVRSTRYLTRFLETQCSTVPLSLIFLVQALLVAATGSAVFRATGLRGVWGIGASSLKHIFKKELQPWEYLVFAAGKMFAMVLAVSVRAPGDVLEPVLIAGGFIGGMVGAAIPGLDEYGALQPCIIFGMVGLFASCFRYPLTPIMIVMELTGVKAYAIVLPTVIVSFTAVTVSDRLCHPILEELMCEEGIDLEELIATATESNNDLLDSTIEERDEEEGEDGDADDDAESRRSSKKPEVDKGASRSNTFGIGDTGIMNLIEDALLTQSGARSRRAFAQSRTHSASASSGNLSLRRLSRRGSHASSYAPSMEDRSRRPSSASSYSHYRYSEHEGRRRVSTTSAATASDLPWYPEQHWRRQQSFAPSDRGRRGSAISTYSRASSRRVSMFSTQSIESPPRTPSTFFWRSQSHLTDAAQRRHSSRSSCRSEEAERPPSRSTTGLSSVLSAAAAAALAAAGYMGAGRLVRSATRDSQEEPPVAPLGPAAPAAHLAEPSDEGGPVERLSDRASERTDSNGHEPVPEVPRVSRGRGLVTAAVASHPPPYAEALKTSAASTDVPELMSVESMDYLDRVSDEGSARPTTPSSLVRLKL